MKFKWILFWVVLWLASCRQPLKPEDVNALFDPTIKMLEEDSYRISNRFHKNVTDRGERPTEKAIGDSILFCDTIFKAYTEFVQRESTNTPELLNEKLSETLLAFKSKLREEHYQQLASNIASSEFFSIKQDRTELKYSVVSEKDFLLYKKYLCMDWLLLAIQFKKVFTEGKLKEMYPLGYFPTLIADRIPVAPGDTMHLTLAGLEYYNQDLTFMVDGKPVKAPNGIGKIDLVVKGDRGKKITRKKIDISVNFQLQDRDTTFSNTVEYEVETCK